MTPVSKWKWYGNAGHFILGHRCRFHLCTKVGKYLISTVGQLWHEEHLRETEASSRGIVLEGMGDARAADYMKKVGYDTLGAGPETFETYVFKAGKPCSAKDCGCGMPDIDGSEIEGHRASSAGEATQMHYKACFKYARKSKRETQ